jgi:hypothetical protein
MNPRQLEEDVKVVGAWISGWVFGAVISMITIVIVALWLALR